MPYCDYDYYSSIFHGSMSEEEFDKNVLIAQSYIDSYARYKLKFDELSEDVQARVMNCLCELTDFTETAVSHKGVASESIGNLSVSYAFTSQDGISTGVNDIILRWLGDIDFSYMLAWV